MNPQQAFARRRIRAWEVVAVGGMAALLCAVLSPLFGTLHQGRSDSCASNLMQIGLAVRIYASDYEETPPPIWSGPSGNNQPGGWIAYRDWPNPRAGDLQPGLGVLDAYTRNTVIFVCPGDTTARGCSYSLNGGLTSDGAGTTGLHRCRSIRGIVAPASTVLLVEERHPLVPGPADGCAVAGCGIAWEWHPGRDDGTQDQPMTHVAFVDGHVKPYKPERMGTRDEPPQWRWSVANAR